MPRPKRKSKGLPTRVYKKGRKYWYVTKANKWLSLGTTESEMYQALASLHTSAERSITDVIAEWQVAPDGFLALAPQTQRTWLPMIPRLVAFFGDARPDQIRPHHVREFMDYDRHHFVTQSPGRLGRVSANRHVAILSTVLSWAIQRGYLHTNPCHQVTRNKERPRTYLPTVEEFLAARSRASPELGLLMDFSFISGARRGDAILLEWTDVGPGGIEYVPGKTAGTDGRVRVIPLTDAVQTVLARARALHRAGPRVFMPPQSLRWTAGNLNAAWRRLKPGFHFHDIRAMAASMHESLADAQVLLAHSGETTAAVYRRGKVRVSPLPLLEDPGFIRNGRA